jgi:hypothetical protein
MSNARRFSPTVVATVTPKTVETRQGASGPYAFMEKALVEQEGKAPLVRSVMAFSQSGPAVAAMLAAGRPVKLALRFSGGTMTVLGVPREKKTQEPAPQDETAFDPTTTTAALRPYAETAAETIDTILAEAGIEGDMAVSIQQAMITGESDRPVDEDRDLDADLVESHGHLFLPLLDAGIAYDDALCIARTIDCTQAASYLADMAELRRQTVARDFV